MNRMRRVVQRKSSSDHAMATAARIFLGAAGVLAGILVVRSIPDLVRYVKIERM